MISLFVWPKSNIWLLDLMLLFLVLGKSAAMPVKTSWTRFVMPTPDKSAIMANLLQKVLVTSLATQQNKLFSYSATQAACLHFILDALAWIRRANSCTHDINNLIDWPIRFDIRGSKRGNLTVPTVHIQSDILNVWKRGRNGNKSVHLTSSCQFYKTLCRYQVLWTVKGPPWYK